MGPRLLLLLPQWPRDPASGAARNLLTATRMLAARGWEVCVLGTTASESSSGVNVMTWAHAAGVKLIIEQHAERSSHLFYVDRGISFRLIDVGTHSPWTWERDFGRQFDLLYDKTLDQFRPQIIYTFGGGEADRKRRETARRRGVVVVFGLQNLSYLDRCAFDQVNTVLCCSEFLRDHYRKALGLQLESLPLPIDPSEVIATSHVSVFVTMVNPTREKGLMFFARLCEELGRTRPDIPILVVGSRSKADEVAAAGAAEGFDLRRHDSVLYSPGAMSPKDIFAVTRILLAPSVWQEPAGRIAAEALLNGIPPIVSNRGGLPEVCYGGGFVLSLPPSLTVNATRPVAVADVAPWIELIERLTDDDQFYDEACDRARFSGEAYAFDRVADAYDRYFRDRLEDGT